MVNIYKINTGWHRTNCQIACYSKGLTVGMRYSILAYLIEIEELGIKIMFDTGVSSKQKLDLGSYTRFVSIEDYEENHLLRQLEQLHIYPDSIDFVVNSHLHYDHCAGNYIFKDKKIFVQSDEYSEYKRASDLSQYYRYLYEQKGNYCFVEDNHKIIDEQGIRISLIRTPGHSAGHQIMLIDSKDYLFVFTGDTLYQYKNQYWTYEMPWMKNYEEASQSKSKVEGLLLAKNKKVLLFESHKIEDKTDFTMEEKHE